MTSVRRYFLVVLIALSLLLLSVDAKRNTKQRRQQQQQRRRNQESDEGLNDNLAVRRTKGGGSVPPELPTLPPIPFSTKSPSRSSTLSPTVPKGQDPTGLEPSPSPPPTTNPPIVSSPTTMPSTNQESPVVAEGSSTPAPSTSSGLVSPTEIAEEQSRTRSLLPFSLNITDQPRVDDVRLAIEDYLYQRLTESFSTLESILLTVTNEGQRKLSIVPRLQQQQQQEKHPEQRHREQQEDEQVTVVTFDFTGVAVFFSEEAIPTEADVQREQLKALEDFHRLNQFVKTVRGQSWQIDTIQLDGIIINKDGMVVGDAGQMVNEGDTMVQESFQSQGDNDNNSALAISLSVVLTLLVLVGIVGLFVYRRRSNNAEDEPKETYQELIRSAEDLPKDLEPLPNDKTMNISFESATVATTSFDSVQLPLTDYGPSPVARSSMDWNRVFALSQTPVEQTMGEVFEAKTITPPKSTKVHEIVTLAPVAESEQDCAPGQGEDVSRDGEDSYGYDTLPEGGHQDRFVFSSPVAAPREENAGNDNDDDFVPRGDHYNQDMDLTIDLSDFNIDPENDPK